MMRGKPSRVAVAIATTVLSASLSVTARGDPIGPDAAARATYDAFPAKLPPDSKVAGVWVIGTNTAKVSYIVYCSRPVDAASGETSCKPQRVAFGKAFAANLPPESRVTGAWIMAPTGQVTYCSSPVDVNAGQLTCVQIAVIYGP